MKTPKLLALFALGAGLLTAATTSPAFAKSGSHIIKANKTNALGLSSDQRAQIKVIHKDAEAQIKALKADKTLSKKDRHARLTAIYADRDAKTNALLTPQQLQELEAKKAKKHATTKTPSA